MSEHKENKLGADIYRSMTGEPIRYNPCKEIALNGSMFCNSITDGSIEIKPPYLDFATMDNIYIDAFHKLHGLKQTKPKHKEENMKASRPVLVFGTDILTANDNELLKLTKTLQSDIDLRNDSIKSYKEEIKKLQEGIADSKENLTLVTKQFSKEFTKLFSDKS